MDNSEAVNSSNDEEERKPEYHKSKENKKKTKTTKTTKGKYKDKDKGFLSGISKGFLDNKSKQKDKGKKNQNKKNNQNKKKQTPKQTPKGKKHNNHNHNNNNNNNKKKDKDKDKDKNNESQVHKQLKTMGYTQNTINIVSKYLAKTATVRDYVDQIEQMNKKAMNDKQKQETMDNMEEKIGYRLKPNDIEVGKNAEGNMFLCIGPRKDRVSLKEYKYLKCWVSLKQKLKKKGHKKALHEAVLIDFRDKSDVCLKDVDRQRLQQGFDNVLSFDFNKVMFVYVVSICYSYYKYKIQNI